MRDDSRRVIVTALALVLANLIIYLPTRNYPFINLDDPLYVSANPHVANGLSWDGILWAFTDGSTGHWHPLTWMSHMLDVQVFGIVAGPAHLINLLLHTCSSVLLFIVLFRMTKAFGPSAFVAAVFATHPLRVESVAWVAERKDVLSTLFWMLTLMVYTRYVHRASVARRIAVFVIFALGLMAKSMILTLPFVLLLLDVWPLDRVADTTKWASWRPVVFEKIPMFALVIASSVVSIIAAQTSGATSGLDAIPLGVRVGNAFVSYAFYLVKLIWPSGLAPFYPFTSQPWWWIAVSVVTLGIVTVYALRSFRARPYWTTGWLWYLVCLLPVIGLVQTGPQARADRYSYIPSIGVLIVIAWGLPELLRSWRYRNAILRTAAGIVICASTVAARSQVRYWRSDTALWEHSIAVTDNNYMAHTNLGVAFAALGKGPEASSQYNDAIRIGESLQFKPNLAVAHNGLGLELARRGQSIEAISEYQKAILADPSLPAPHNNLGIVLTHEGRLDDAISEFEEALRIAAGDAAIYSNLGMLLAQKGRTGEAIQRYSAALRIQPNDAETHNRLGLLQSSQGSYDQAISSYDEALQINPALSAALRNKGVALANLGRITEAIDNFRKALTIDPNDAEAYSDLGTTLANLGNDSDAVACYLRALRINPNFVDAHYNLGAALENLGRTEEALREYAEVLRLNPGHVAARHAMEELRTPARIPGK